LAKDLHLNPAYSDASTGPCVQKMRRKKPVLQRENWPEPLSHHLGSCAVVSSSRFYPFKADPRYESFFLLCLYGLRITVRFQAEYIILNLVIELHAAVVGQPVVAGMLKELLFQQHVPLLINP